jgi:hypothetical protein
VGDLLHFNQDTAGKLFFADLSLKDQEKYAKALRPMRARKEDIILPKRPDTREYAIIGLNDLVLNPDWQEARAEITIGEDAIIPMESGHSPFLSHPEELGKVIFGIMQDHT